AGGLRRHARTRSSADWRAEKRDAVHGASSLEAARVARIEGEAALVVLSAIAPPIFRVRTRSASLLAAAVLRLQRVEREEEEGETGIHAPESDHPQASQAPEQLAVEQLVVLCQGRGWDAAHRSGGIEGRIGLREYGRERQEESAPFRGRKDAAPQTQSQHEGPATRPSWVMLPFAS